MDKVDAAYRWQGDIKQCQKNVNDNSLVAYASKLHAEELDSEENELMAIAA